MRRTVQSYEYFGHDAVVRVRPDDEGLPELVVRITGGVPLEPGHPCRGQGARGRGRLAHGGWASPSQKLPEPRLRNYLACRPGALELPSEWYRRSGMQGGAMADVPTPTSGGFTGRRCVVSWGSPTASWTTGPEPGCSSRRWPRRKGSGTRRVYSYSDVLELKVIKQLLDAGVSLQSARRAVECLREDLGADLASANLVLTGHQFGARPLQRRGRRPAGRRPGRVQHRAVGRRGRRARGRHRAPRHRRPGAPAGERPASAPVARGPPASDRSRPSTSSARVHHPACVPAGQVRFAHPSERLFAALLDLYEERWEYEPVEFPLALGRVTGSPVSGFRPDFCLPEPRHRSSS